MPNWDTYDQWANDPNLAQAWMTFSGNEGLQGYYDQYVREQRDASTSAEYGTSLNPQQSAALLQALQSLGGNLSAADIREIQRIPLEAWQNPETAQALNDAIVGIAHSNAPDPTANDGVDPAGNYRTLLSQVSGNMVGTPWGRPVSDLYQPVQNVGSTNVAQAALLGAGGAVGGATGAFSGAATGGAEAAGGAAGGAGGAGGTAGAVGGADAAAGGAAAGGTAGAAGGAGGAGSGITAGQALTGGSIVSRLLGGGGGGGGASGTPGAGGSGGGGLMDLLGPLLGGGAGIYGLTQGNRMSNPALTGQQQDLINAGNQTYQTALDPRQELYGRTQQQLQDQTRSSDSARGVAMSPYSAGVENRAMSDFNIDWQNAQLGRQVAGVGAMTGANNASTGIGQLGLQNRQFGANQNTANLTALLTALRGGGAAGGGLSGIGSYLTNLFGGGASATGGQPTIPGGAGGVEGGNYFTGGQNDFGNDPSLGAAGGGFNDFTGGFSDMSAPYVWGTPTPGSGGGYNYNVPMPGQGGSGGAGYYGKPISPMGA